MPADQPLDIFRFLVNQLNYITTYYVLSSIQNLPPFPANPRSTTFTFGCLGPTSLYRRGTQAHLPGQGSSP
jgi:hypothetical protein